MQQCSLFRFISIMFVFLVLPSCGHGKKERHEHNIDAHTVSEAAAIPATKSNDVIRISWPREDVPVLVDGMKLPPAAGITSWAAFKSMGDKAMLMGDTVVFEDEVSPAMDAAFASGLEVTALHNHFFYDEPKVYFMHIGGEGETRSLALGVKKVWDAIKEVRRKQTLPAKRFSGDVPVKTGKIDAAEIEKIIGHKATLDGGVVKLSIGRKAKMHGMEFDGSMGLSTWAAFTGNDENAVVDGDFAMTKNEVQPVLKVLRQHGIHVVALHNHMIGEDPHYYFTHYWGKGSAKKLAQGIKAALDVQGE